MVYIVQSAHIVFRTKPAVKVHDTAWASTARNTLNSLCISFIREDFTIKTLIFWTHILLHAVTWGTVQLKKQCFIRRPSSYSVIFDYFCLALPHPTLCRHGLLTSGSSTPYSMCRCDLCLALTDPILSLQIAYVLVFYFPLCLRNFCPKHVEIQDVIFPSLLLLPCLQSNRCLYLKGSIVDPSMERQQQ